MKRQRERHVGHVDPVKLATKRVGCLNHMEQIALDTSQLQKGGRRFQTYWDNLIIKYDLGFTETKPAEFKVFNKNQEVRQELANALGLATTKCNKERDIEPLLIFLAQCKTMNKRNCVGFLCVW